MKDKRFCVYFHVNPLSGKVFYIGKGTLLRAFNKNGRSRVWNSYVESLTGDFIVKIFKDNLTTTEALLLEKQLICSGEYPELINVVSSSATLTSLLEIANNFYYDPSSPSGLRWKEDRLSGQYFQTRKIKAGDIAGCLKKDQGYYEVRCNGKSYKCHRIVWVLLNNIEIPDGMVINHKDCNRSNNNIENLEIVTMAENNRKAKHHINDNVVISSNSSGVTGVSLRGGKYPSWLSRFSNKEGRFAKSFSINKLGYERAFELAVAFRKQMEELYYK